MDQPTTFKRGDTVVLKSGGPPMQVAAASMTLVYCTWIDADGNAQSGTFEANSVQGDDELAATGLMAAASMLDTTQSAAPMQLTELPPPQDPAAEDGEPPEAPGSSDPA